MAVQAHHIHWDEDLRNMLLAALEARGATIVAHELMPAHKQFVFGEDVPAGATVSEFIGVLAQRVVNNAKGPVDVIAINEIRIDELDIHRLHYVFVEQTD